MEAKPNSTHVLGFPCDCGEWTHFKCYEEYLQHDNVSVLCIICKKQIPAHVWVFWFKKSETTSLLNLARIKWKESLLREEKSTIGQIQPFAQNRVDSQDRTILGNLKEVEQVLKAQLKSATDVVHEKQALVKVIKFQLAEHRELVQAEAERFKNLQSVSETVLRSPSVNCFKPFCAGFLNAEKECNVCSILFCSRCNKDHPLSPCNEDDVATVQAILADSTPCPRCGEHISRVEGCNTMFCTKCSQFFGYETGSKLYKRTDLLENFHHTESLKSTSKLPTEEALLHAHDRLLESQILLKDRPANQVMLFYKKFVYFVENLKKQSEDANKKRITASIKLQLSKMPAWLGKSSDLTVLEGNIFKTAADKERFDHCLSIFLSLELDYARALKLYLESAGFDDLFHSTLLIQNELNKSSVSNDLKINVVMKIKDESSDPSSCPVS
jgi:hypothetical protein